MRDLISTHRTPRKGKLFEFINFKDEAVALTKWLISIPSVTTTKGETDIAEAVWRSLKDTGYFKENPDNLIYVPHQDGVHHSICALVKYFWK